MKEKLEFLLKNKALTATSFARLLDVQPSSISHILSGRNKPSFDFVVKILKAFPDLNPDWLLLDSDQVFRSDAVPTPATPVGFPDEQPSSDVSLFSVEAPAQISANEREQKNDRPNLFTPPCNGGKKVERIIVLYSDRSFESYTEI